VDPCYSNFEAALIFVDRQSFVVQLDGSDWLVLLHGDLHQLEMENNHVLLLDG